MTRYPDTQINTGTATGSAIAVIDVTGEGAEPVVLTDWSMYATYPDWRPGSDEILFSTYDLNEFPATDEPSNLYTIKSDGSGQTALTSFGRAEQRATQPTWTPDGSRIIFTLVGQPGRRRGLPAPRCIHRRERHEPRRHRGCRDPSSAAAGHSIAQPPNRTGEFGHGPGPPSDVCEWISGSQSRNRHARAAASILDGHPLETNS